MTRRAGWLVAALAVAAVSVLFLWVSRGNPPGFYKDEAAIGWNAHTIAETGKDEYGNTWPLFFRSFDDWKSPVYVYLLAAEFRVAPDGILAARLLSAVLGAAAVILLGLLAGRIARNAAVAVAVMLSAALNPWLFEVSRLVFEVAAFPLLLVLFLLALRRAYDGGIWRWSDAALVALPLGLLVYAYPTGRLFAPALAVGLALFGGYGRWPGVFRAWAVFAVTLVPIVVFSARNPGALSARLNPWTTYLHSGASPGFVVETFVKNYAANLNPWRWLADGDPNVRHHVPGTGSILVATAVLAVAGLVLVALRERGNAWWRFCVFGLVLSPVPASLTYDRLHTLRMIPFPVFLLVLTIPALAFVAEPVRLTGWRVAAAGVLAAGTLGQAAVFQVQFRDRGPDRGGAFEAEFPGALDAALANGRRPVRSPEREYVLAAWYGLSRDASPPGDLRRLDGDPPPGALVLAEGEPCTGCRVVARSGPFTAWLTPVQR